MFTQIVSRGSITIICVNCWTSATPNINSPSKRSPAFWLCANEFCAIRRNFAAGSTNTIWPKIRSRNVISIVSIANSTDWASVKQWRSCCEHFEMTNKRKKNLFSTLIDAQVTRERFLMKIKQEKARQRGKPILVKQIRCHRWRTEWGDAGRGWWLAENENRETEDRRIHCSLFFAPS